MERGWKMNFSRRAIIAWAGAVGGAYACLTCSIATAQTDPLPSWSNGSAIQAITEFDGSEAGQRQADIRAA